MEQEMFFRQAMVCESFSSAHSFQMNTNEYQVAKDLPQGGHEEDDLQERLISHIKDVIPELAAEEISNAVAFHEVTDKNLPSCYFVVGDVLRWNETFIPQRHPVRRHCGEGPFKVVRDESYLVAFVKDSNNKVTSDIKVGSNRLVLLNLSSLSLVIAHGSFFIAVQEK